ncbi:MAG: type II secretion system GspH family protein [Candidatus Gastranaerophilales bacterium]|nr:type II secretion system GspH family protein [Candidatus Gastranaerophilales bacterium]
MFSPFRFFKTKIFYKRFSAHTKIFAFTLAETLITLAIIGVVAAITVPAVLNHYREQEVVTKIKKVHSTISQALQNIELEEGYSIGDLGDIDSDEFFELFSKAVNTLKICKVANQGCFTSNYIKSMTGANWSKYDTAQALLTADGTAYGYDKRFCDNKGLSDDDYENCIGRFIVDINGDLSPNQFGLDVFFFTVVAGKGSVPAGSGNDSADCKKGQRGITCAAKILREEKMNYL